MKKQKIKLIIIIALVVIGILILQRSANKNSGGINKTVITTLDSSVRVLEKEKIYPRAIEISNPTGFINTNSTKIGDLIGKKVILLDFWTYSCINCLRTIPYLNNWYSKYKDQGLEIIGIHTPEFVFEKDYNNVLSATKRLNITYPVVLDSNYGTWSAYSNQYWPRELLIDIDGFIVHDSIGEGNYAESEAKIQELLKERASVLNISQSFSGTDITQILNQGDLSKIASPETYFGAERNYLSNGYSQKVGEQILTDPSSIELNHLYLSGKWNFQNEYAQSESALSKIFYRYNSKNVYFVASAPENITLHVNVDGKDLSDVIVNENRLYNIVSGSDYGQHALILTADKPGLNAFTFTFG